MQRQLREHAGVANEPDLSGRDRAHALVVPHRGAGSDSRPTPPQRVLHGHCKERFGCSLQRRSSGGVSLGGQLSHARKQQLEGPRGSPRWRRKRPDGAPDFQDDVPLPRHARRAPGVQVGLARELQVERLKSAGGLEQQRRSIAGGARGEGDVAAEQVHPGALDIVERPGLRRGQESQSRVERAGLEARLRRG